MFKARFFLEAVENKNTEQITIAKAESYRLITDDSIIVHYFNKAFFELIKKEGYEYFFYKTIFGDE